MGSMRRTFALGTGVALAAVLLAGCGQKGGSGSGSGGSSKSGPKIGLVTDIGGLNDRSFNFLADQGYKRAQAKLSITGSVIESKSDSDYPRNLGTQVKNGSKLVFGIGFLMGDAVKTAAAKAPNTHFAIIDYSYTDPSGKWTATSNVVGIQFKEQEAGYLAGILAGAAEQDGTLKGLNPQKVLSVIGGQKIPPVDRYIAGFQAGVKHECTACRVDVAYSQDFVDQAKCQDRALGQIARGSDIVFQVAGQCGLGALDAAKQKGVWGIGVDADQAYLGPHILTSAIKRIDNAVFDEIQAEKDGKFQGGTDRVFGLKDDGVGLGKVASAATKYQSKVDDASKAVIAGSVQVPATVA